MIETKQQTANSIELVTNRPILLSTKFFIS